jgi:hypothetical protein
MNYFLEGGWPMWLILLFTGVGLTAGVVSLGAARGRAGVALGAGTLVVALMIVGAGLFGWQLGRAQTDAAVVYASPADVEVLRAQGYEESSHALVCGLAGAAIPLILGIAAIALSLSRASSEPGAPRRG